MENIKENLEIMINILGDEIEKHKHTIHRRCLAKIYDRYERCQVDYYKRFGNFYKRNI